jgi:hypothetical protein
MPGYDLTGATYSHIRRPDPRIAAAINRALAGAASVASVGAGAGAGLYEPAQTIVAIEPSRVMIRQRAGKRSTRRSGCSRSPAAANWRGRSRPGGADRLPSDRPGGRRD